MERRTRTARKTGLWVESQSLINEKLVDNPDKIFQTFWKEAVEVQNAVHKSRLISNVH